MHGSSDCDECHGGDPTAETRALAHVGLVPDPTFPDPSATCYCHVDAVAQAANNLHYTLGGMRHALAVRSGGEPLGGTMTTVFNNHCGRCHSSCGDCHFSVPSAAGGGLLAGHLPRRTPSMNLVCTACHGSRVGDEYKGLNAGVPADLHYNAGQQCTHCHTGAEMHGAGAEGVTHRTQVTSAPRCSDCHPDDAAFLSTAAHNMHRDTDGSLKLSCQVCHSVQYKNCSSCHVSIDPATSKPVYEVNAPDHLSVMAFKIGFNPRQDAQHPERWVTLRHVPAAPDNYDYYGVGLSSTFDLAPSWILATPHNIQRVTPQNSGCTSTCHGHRELFLDAADVPPAEQTANLGVIVPDDQLP